MPQRMNRSLLATVVAWLAVLAPSARGQDPADWPTYNHDPAGWRFNPAEKTLGPANVGQARREVAVPGGGLEGDDRRRPRHADRRRRRGLLRHRHVPGLLQARAGRQAALGLPQSGPEGRPAAARRRAHHREAARRGLGRRASSPRRWSPTGPSTSRTRAAGCTASTPRRARNAGRSSTRAKEFPDAHWNNLLMASPILADGKVVFARRDARAALRRHEGVSRQHRPRVRRGARAEDGQAGLEVRCRPEAGEARPAGRRGGRLGQVHVRVRARDEQRLVHADLRPGIQHALLRHRREHRAAAADEGEPEPRHGGLLRGRVPGRGHRQAEVEHADQPRRHVDELDAGLRLEDRAVQGLLDRRLAEDLHHRRWTASGPRSSGSGCKNGGFYLLRADDGKLVKHTPLYTGPPTHPPEKHDPRVLALPSPIGGLQTGCATDGKTIFTNGIDAVRLATQASPAAAGQVPTGGRVTATSVDLATERWRHERPKIAEMGGTPEQADVPGRRRRRRLGHRGGQRRGVLHRRRQRQAGRPRREHGPGAEGDRPRPGVRRAVAVARPRVRRRRQHALQPRASPSASSPSNTPAASAASGLPDEAQA